MNEITKSILEGIVEDDNPKVPEYGFTVNDYLDVLRKKGLPVINKTTAYRRLEKRADEGELVKVKLSTNDVYFVPAELKKNMELDKEAIISA